ncbi:hypothetical protein HPB48_025448 [Haemaphysalis longicornis]|uniref:Uncharacterized protein n=1 Tax=Haemaphysalis longicornis TaxID=44386 RepID=A0A9J6H9C8_HAELO|nr:hypothetical protein HPB48_025448 [Haemaphysalis longicornis]
MRLKGGDVRYGVAVTKPVRARCLTRPPSFFFPGHGDAERDEAAGQEPPSGPHDLPGGPAGRLRHTDLGVHRQDSAELPQDSAEERSHQRRLKTRFGALSSCRARTLRARVGEHTALLRTGALCALDCVNREPSWAVTSEELR